MKHYYIAVQRERETGFQAYAIRVSESDNLVAKLSGYFAANICPTKRRAWEIANAWNNQFIANGTYYWKFDNADDGEPLPF